MNKISILILVVVILLAGCNTHNSVQVAKTGELPIRMNLESALNQNITISRIAVKITKGAFTDEMDLNITGHLASGTFTELELGTYAIDVDVYDGLMIIATGHGTGTVLPAQSTTVYITLQFNPGDLEIIVNWGLPYEDCRRILLVGNSHTFYNYGVETHLNQLVNAVHPEWNVLVNACTMGGYTLENHYNDQNSMNTIATGDWDLVILQEQSSRPMQYPDLFYQYSILLSDFINQSGALTGFYMTWAWRNNPEMYEPIRDAYYYIGAYLDALVVPAGVAFYNAYQTPTPPDLYSPDNYHPSIYGTYLVACTMLASIWNVNPIGNPYFPVEISADDALFLQQIAWATVQSEAKNDRGIDFRKPQIRQSIRKAA